MSIFNQVLHAMDAQQLAAVSLASREGNAQATELNVAAWLNAPGCCDEEFSLMLCYVDGGKTHEIPVDQGRVNAMQDILLSGIARLQIRKRLEQVELQVRGNRRPPRLVVESVCLHPA